MQMNLIIGNTSNRSYSPRITTPPAPNPPPPKKGYKRPTLVFFIRSAMAYFPYISISLYPNSACFEVFFTQISMSITFRLFLLVVVVVLLIISMCNQMVASEIIP